MDGSKPEETAIRGHLRRAIALAVESVERGGGPFGAVIVRDGTVLGEGANRVTLDRDPTAHAEIVAIRRACSDLGSFRLPGAAIFSSCEPCPMCLGAIHWARMDAVWYAADRRDAQASGFDDLGIYEELERPPAERSLPARRALAEEGRAPFEAWRSKRDRTPY